MFCAGVKAYVYSSEYENFGAGDEPVGGEAGQTVSGMRLSHSSGELCLVVFGPTETKYCMLIGVSYRVGPLVILIWLPV